MEQPRAAEARATVVPPQAGVELAPVVLRGPAAAAEGQRELPSCFESVHRRGEEAEEARQSGGAV